MNFKDADTDINLRRKLIALVFGETTRWHEMDYQEDPRSPFSSLWMLFSNAAKSASIRMAFRLTYEDFKEELKGWLGFSK
jgi:lipoprotein NlpI